jgi:VIT1/CCC1 family predicted Fe2+/Mn2+ transporter
MLLIVAFSLSCTCCCSPVQLAGVAGLFAGALSMAAGEYISVASQKDAEEADIEKERAEQQKGPHARLREFEELVSLAGCC